MAHRYLEDKHQGFGSAITSVNKAIEGKVVDAVGQGVWDEAAAVASDVSIDETLQIALQWCDMQMTPAETGAS